jgi:hypothetical protein
MKPRHKRQQYMNPGSNQHIHREEWNDETIPGM